MAFEPAVLKKQQVTMAVEMLSLLRYSSRENVISQIKPRTVDFETSSQ